MRMEKYFQLHPYYVITSHAQLDSERGNYRLQEGRLVEVLLRACGVSKTGMAAKAARGWKKPGVKGVGEFARVMQEAGFDVGVEWHWLAGKGMWGTWTRSLAT